MLRDNPHGLHTPTTLEGRRRSYKSTSTRAIHARRDLHITLGSRSVWMMAGREMRSGHAASSSIRLYSAARSPARILAAALGCAVLGAITTWSPAAHAFRTGSDLPELAGTERVRWKKDFIGYQLYDAGAPGLPFDLVEEEVQAVLSSWKVDCGGPSFAYYGATSAPALPADGVNTIQWI